MRHVIEVYMNYKAILKSLLFVKSAFLNGYNIIKFEKTIFKCFQVL